MPESQPYEAPKVEVLEMDADVAVTAPIVSVN